MSQKPAGIQAKQCRLADGDFTGQRASDGLLAPAAFRGIVAKLLAKVPSKSPAFAQSSLSKTCSA